MDLLNYSMMGFLFLFAGINGDDVYITTPRGNVIEWTTQSDTIRFAGYRSMWNDDKPNEFAIWFDSDGWNLQLYNLTTDRAIMWSNKRGWR